MSTDLIITDHAIERASLRLGLNARAARRTAIKAFTHGVKHSEVTGELSRYLDRVFLSHEAANNIRIYGEHLWLFKGPVLLTIFRIPNELKRHLKRLKKHTSDQ